MVPLLCAPRIAGVPEADRWRLPARRVLRIVLGRGTEPLYRPLVVVTTKPCELVAGLRIWRRCAFAIRVGIGQRLYTFPAFWPYWFISIHLHPTTNLRSVQSEGPLVITRGEGVYVYDEEGRRYLEGMSGLWCASLDFSERRLAEAAYRQMCELPFYHSFGGKVPAISTELAERLIGIAPAGMAKVLFANSGSEANDTAIKLA